MNARAGLALALALAAVALFLGGGATAAGPAARPAAAPKPLPAPAPLAVAPEFRLRGELTQGGWVVGILPAGATAPTLDGAALAVDADGRFMAAFDRDAGAEAVLAARLADGTMLVRKLAIAPRAWRIEHVNVARRPSVPDREFERLRGPELARINAARKVNATITGWRQRFIWPARGRISGRFGSQRVYKGEPGSYHSGLDIAGGAGAAFVAPADGVVVLAAQQPFTLEGRLLMIDHGMGLTSAFLHCSELAVKEGDRVVQGQVVGRIGATGRASGPHLHWGLKWRAARLDPLLFLPPPS